jgi:hypothetical protein
MGWGVGSPQRLPIFWLFARDGLSPWGSSRAARAPPPSRAFAPTKRVPTQMCPYSLHSPFSSVFEDTRGDNKEGIKCPSFVRCLNFHLISTTQKPLCFSCLNSFLIIFNFFSVTHFDLNQGSTSIVHRLYGAYGFRIPLGVQHFPVCSGYGN